ncbi:MAG TPA: hypothetical protein PKW41_12560 [Clostridia bacterium]|nr:hypothetical protein [Clostridia bacterium]
MTYIKLGIDNGNYNTKSSERMLYASGFAQSDKSFITNDMQLFFDGAYYAVGGKRMSFQQDKTKEPDTFILSLPAIAHAMRLADAQEADITLGVGLPIDIYGAQKNMFRDYFLRGDIAFEYEDMPYRCRIADCRVFAQGHAALCKHYGALRQCTTITLVDIGGYTVDILSLRDFKVDRGSCVSLRMGTIMLFNAIRGELQQANIILSDELIADAIRGRIQHADKERIISVAERHVQHYHLHVVYVPIVEKEIKWSKRCKDKALVGTIREVIRQVSHSKKWKSERITDEHGNVRLIPSYSLLQDRFFEHMKNAGYNDIERGERHSAEANLAVAEFKARQEQARAQELERNNDLAERQLNELNAELNVTAKTANTIHEIESMGSKTLFGKIELSPKEHSTLTALAKEGLTSRAQIFGLEHQLDELNRRFCQLKDSYHELYAGTREFFRAVKLAPQAVMDLFAQLFAREAQEREAEKQAQRDRKIERTKNRTGGRANGKEEETR